MRKALELALDWIKKQPEETPHTKYDVDTRYVVLRELEAALAQPKQKNCEYNNGTCTRNGCRGVCQAEICRKKVEAMEAQPEQEPVACDCTNPWAHDQCTEAKGCKIKKKLLRTPPQPKEPEQEPVALQYPQKDIDWQREQQIKAQASTPPQRKPLKYEEYSALAETYTIDYGLLDCVDNHLYKPLQGIKG